MAPNPCNARPPPPLLAPLPHTGQTSGQGPPPPPSPRQDQYRTYPPLWARPGQDVPSPPSLPDTCENIAFPLTTYVVGKNARNN